MTRSLSVASRRVRRQPFSCLCLHAIMLVIKLVDGRRRRVPPARPPSGASTSQWSHPPAGKSSHYVHPWRGRPKRAFYVTMVWRGIQAERPRSSVPFPSHPRAAAVFAPRCRPHHLIRIPTASPHPAAIMISPIRRVCHPAADLPQARLGGIKSGSSTHADDPSRGRLAQILSETTHFPSVLPLRSAWAVQASLCPGRLAPSSSSVNTHRPPESAQRNSAPGLLRSRRQCRPRSSPHVGRAYDTQTPTTCGARRRSARSRNCRKNPGNRRHLRDQPVLSFSADGSPRNPPGRQVRQG